MPDPNDISGAPLTSSSAGAGPTRPQYIAQKAAEACDEHAQGFWLEVERAVTELLTEAAPPGTTQH